MELIPDADTSLVLTRAEALILFEWLHELADQGRYPGDHAEVVALMGLSAALEKALKEPFDERYQELLVEAKAYIEKRYPFNLDGIAAQ